MALQFGAFRAQDELKRPLTGKRTVERVLAHMIQVQMIGFEQATLFRTFPKHDPNLLLAPQELNTSCIKMPTFRPDL